ncbi:alanine dehydrogenase [Candidatus Woesearchaeota archaeon]|nr:alanine dehydrogenase [Candidatus Woesearchaeota archaeon]
MIIGTIKEVKDNENRVGLLPSSVKLLVANKHEVYVEKNAGTGTGFSDGDYEKAGAIILDNAVEVAKKADILVKIKEPMQEEFTILEALAGKTLYTYLHLAAAPKELTLELIKHKITSIAYETIEKNGRLPCLAPMSKIAGILAVQYSSQYLQKKYGGRGVSMGHVKGADTANVVVIGGGVVGKKAALTACGMGASVTVFEINEERAQYVQEECGKVLAGKFFSNLSVETAEEENLVKAIKEADVLIGAVLVKGSKAPRIITKEMIDVMQKGAVIIDVAIDQGGCIWGSKPTSHSQPTYDYEGKIYCCITNMPGQVPLQATQALTATTIPYLLQMANKGIEETVKGDSGFAQGLNVYQGKIVYKGVADALGLDYTELRFS